MTGLSIQDLESGYENKIVIRELSLEVGPQEILVLMGPSGSGKTTLLLTILGIIQPQKGKILLNDREITNLPIERRNIGYVPQDYGLFPHLKVLDNVAYGLRVRRVSKEERERIALQTIELVELQGLESQRPRELSGGQRQRVALARALAISPNLFLLDEPLANIDEVTKLDVAKNLKELLRKLKMPTIIVTHNRDDAIFLAERLAIMVEGRIEQVGAVKDILRSPKTSMIKRLLTPITQQ
jgi:ABC-type Fe3+/spermidine/putrescine transport system ATPase subunit